MPHQYATKTLNHYRKRGTCASRLGSCSGWQDMQLRLAREGEACCAFGGLLFRAWAAGCCYG